jgi:ribonucleoside-diphosphate reductase alpha chain
MGLKCVAIYRDGSKRSQPLNTKKTTDGGGPAATAPLAEGLESQLKELETEVTKLRIEVGRPLRRRLPETRMAVNHKFNIAGHEGYLNVGLFEHHQPGELFITMAKEGSTIGGLMDTIATLTSIALQYGVPLETLVKKFSHQRFEPSGVTKNRDIRFASSITDYIFRWLAIQFIPGYREETTPDRGQQELPIPGLLEEIKQRVNKPVPDLPLDDEGPALLSKPDAAPRGAGPHPSPAPLSPGRTTTSTFVNMSDAPMCPNCGHVAVRNGACFKCLNRGESLGCS